MTAVGVRPGPGGGAAEGVGARSSEAGDGGCSRLSYTKLDVAVRDGRWELSRRVVDAQWRRCDWSCRGAWRFIGRRC